MTDISSRKRMGVELSRPALGEAAMTGTERQRIERWHDTVARLAGRQAEYTASLEALPDNQPDSATAEALRAIAELDLSELQAIEPPRGLGRD